MATDKNASDVISPTKAKPRPRVTPLWRARWVVASVMALLVGGAVGGAWWSIERGLPQKAAKQAKWQVIAATAGLGFRVEEIMVSGRQQTTRPDLLAAVRLSRGAPILAFDVAAARGRIEALPWIKAATVERMLPNTVLITVKEREPLALWQLEGQLALIDTEGETILQKGLEAYSKLLLVVGDGAPKEAADLIATLSTQPALMAHVRAATWVGGRRWNVHLKGGIDVRLPEDEAAGAWQRLARYQREHDVLKRNVRVLDLRLPDRLIVREAPGGGNDAEQAEQTDPGKQT